MVIGGHFIMLNSNRLFAIAAARLALEVHVYGSCNLSLSFLFFFSSP